jgi:hypothetical protein
MIRRDYIIAAIEEFVAMLAKLAGLVKDAQWQAARQATEQQFQRLAGVDAVGLDQMSEMELLAAVMEHEPMLSVENKLFMVAALLKSSGDVAAGEGRSEEAQRRYLKGLHLLLGLFGRNASIQRPDFAPAIESFLAALGDELLPLETRVLLMRHYEQSGQFAKAEDALLAMFDLQPASADLLEFATSFYQRLLARGDTALEAGDLPRSEVEAGLEQVRSLSPPRAGA